MAVVITGASKGLGYALAKKLTAVGHSVYSFSRTDPGDPDIKHIFCDVSDKKSIEEAFRQFFEKETGIEILVNNAGYGISGASECLSEESIKNVFDVNFHGAVQCSQYVIPKMREQGKGKIIFISSAAAVFTIPFQSFYTATKAAMSAFSEGLGMELRPFNIQVGHVILSDTKTEFMKNRKKDHGGTEYYGKRIENSVSLMEKDEHKGYSAEKAAEKIARYIGRRKMKGCIAVGREFKVPMSVLLLINRILPRRWVLGILYRTYGK